MKNLLWKFADDFVVLLASLLGTLIRLKAERIAKPSLPEPK